MKEKIIYVCEFCGKEFENKEDAEKCESNHLTKASLNFEPHYASADIDHTGLPDYLTLKHNDKEYRYERKLVEIKDKPKEKEKDKEKDKNKDKGKDKDKGKG